MSEHRIYYYRHLPHFQPKGATIFVTFRLYGSLPLEVLARLEAQSERFKASLDQVIDPDERTRLWRLRRKQLFGLWDDALDLADSGPFWLQQEAIARQVIESLNYYQAIRYELIAFCIMPNHVHILFTPLQNESGNYYALADIMHSIKLFSARQANAILKRKGQFWQHESYDHAVRDADEKERILHYILNNPVKAKLVEQWTDWPWSYSKFH